jgi:adenylate cyclase
MTPKTRPWFAGMLAGLVVGVVGFVLAVVRPVALERSELWTYDVRLRSAAATRHPRADIVLITVSEQDITSVEDNLSISWPWPRALFGYIATYCKRAGARVITFDWLFQDRGQYSVSDAEELATALRDAGNAVIGLALTTSSLVAERKVGPWAARLGSFATRDEAVAQALKLQAFNVHAFVIGKSPAPPSRSGGASGASAPRGPSEADGIDVWYGGLATQDDLRGMWTRLSRPENARDLVAPDAPADAEAPPPAMRALTADEQRTRLVVADLVAERQGQPGDGPVPVRDGIDPPLGVLAVAPARLGHVHQTSDVDNVMREHAPLVKHDGRLFPSLSLASYLVAHPGTHYTLDGHALVVGDHRFELDDRGAFPIRFVNANTYRTIPAYDILQSQAQLDEGKPPKVPDRELRGAYVIVAATAHGLRDLRQTPMSETQLGAEINANVIDNLEDGAWIQRASPWLDGLFVVLLALATAAVMIALGRAFRRVLIALPVALVSTGAIIGGYVLIARWALVSHDAWLAVATPALFGALSAFVTLLVLSAVERQSRRFVTEALGRYTSPALVRELIEHPEHLSLEWGEEREMSVYFSDIAGFTTISEHLSAKDLVTLLNEYLTEMTDLVLAHGGVVDKYIGDAVMAFWGAPLPDKDHARHAVTCAIAMRARCDELRAGWHERFGQELYARAGISSGEVVVGNMGSKHKYNYTVMGDMVNLASRLEGANKGYGTFLMVNETTVAALGDAAEVRELDLVAVKGKTRPVKVFEVLGLAGKTPAEQIATARAFEQALVAYRAQRFAEAKAMFAELVKTRDDAPSKVYVERCEHFESEPPSTDWDGVWHMKEK